MVPWVLHSRLCRIRPLPSEMMVMLLLLSTIIYRVVSHKCISDRWCKEQFLVDRLNIPRKPKYLKTIYLEKGQTKIALGLVPESHFDFAQSHPEIAEMMLKQYALWHGIRSKWVFQHDPNHKYSWELIANTKQSEPIYLKILE